MKAHNLEKTDKLILTISDISRSLGVNYDSAKVSAARYIGGGQLLRLKRDTYILSSKYPLLTEKEFFMLANILETPSYISLTTALSFYNISTQQLRNRIESVSVKRTKNISLRATEFSFSKIKKNFYCGFKKTENYFIAEKEKVFADAVYLTAINRYTFDFYAIDFKKLNLNAVEKFLKATNDKAKIFWDKLCKTFNL